MKYILLDLDGTLLDFNSGEKNSFREAVKHYTGYVINDIEAKKFSEINEYYFQEYRKNNMTRDEFHYNRFEEMKNYLNLDFDPKLVDEYYIKTLKYQADIYYDVKEILEYLYGKYELYVVSNGMSEVQMKKLELAKIDKYFKKYYISELVGYNKPDLGFFEYVYHDINDMDKSQYVIIGDRLDSDILGGNNFDIKTIYINRNKFIDDKIIPDIMIDSLIELKSIL